MLQTVKSSVSFNLYFWVKNFLTISLCSSTLRQQRLTYTDRRRNDKDYFFYLNPFFLFYSCSYMGSFTFPPSQIQSLLRNNLMIFFHSVIKICLASFSLISLFLKEYNSLFKIGKLYLHLPIKLTKHYQAMFFFFNLKN
jgi:hypothetical protein